MYQRLYPVTVWGLVLFALLSAPGRCLAQPGPGEELLRAQAVIKQLTAQVAKLEAQVDQQQQVIAQLRAEREALQAELAKNRAELVQSVADRDRRLLATVEMAGQLKKVLAEVAQLKAENKKLRELVPKTEDRTKPSSPSAAPSRSAEPPAISGAEVLRVEADGSVVISAGAADGLRVGHKLQVYRDLGDHGIYVGQIEIVQASSKTAKCTTLKLQDTVRQGDRVTARL